MTGMNKIACPKCGGTNLNYDKFEDMYRCGPCYIFWYPYQLGIPENIDAGYRELGNK